MKIKFTQTSYVIDFMNVGYSFEDATKNVLLKLNNEVTDYLPDWTLEFHFIYTKGKRHAIYMRNKSDVKSNIKSISVFVVIPTMDEIPWGVRKDQHITNSTNSVDVNKFIVFESEPELFDNCQDFLEYTFLKSMVLAFKAGFKINSKLCQIDL